MVFNAEGLTTDGLNHEILLPNNNIIQARGKPDLFVTAGTVIEGNTVISRKAFITSENPKFQPKLKCGLERKDRGEKIEIEQRPHNFKNAPAFSFAGGSHGRGKMMIPPVGGRASYLDAMGSAIENPGPGGEPGYGHEMNGMAWMGPQGKFGRGPIWGSMSKRTAQRFPVLRYSQNRNSLQMFDDKDPNTTTIGDNPGPATYFGGNKSSLMRYDGGIKWGSMANRTLKTTRNVDKYLGNKIGTNYTRKEATLFNSGQAMWIPDLTWTPPPDAYKTELETCMVAHESTKHKNSCFYSVGKEDRPPKKQDALRLATANEDNVGPGRWIHPTSLKKAKYSKNCPARNFLQEQQNSVDECLVKRG